MSSMTSPPERGIGSLGFTDVELLPERLGNALNLEIDESRRRGVEIEVGKGSGRTSIQSTSLPHYNHYGETGHQRTNTFPHDRPNPFPNTGSLDMYDSPLRGRIMQLNPRMPTETGQFSDIDRLGLDYTSKPSGDLTVEPISEGLASPSGRIWAAFWDNNGNTLSADGNLYSFSPFWLFGYGSRSFLTRAFNTSRLWSAYIYRSLWFRTFRSETPY